MDTTYKLSWVENKTIFDKPAKECTAESGEKFTIYKFDKENKEFPDFEAIAPGASVTGNLYTNAKGYKTLYAPKVRATRGPNYGMKAAQERKAEHIEEAQENKFNHIKESGAQRDAVLIVTNFYAPRWSNDPLLGDMDLDSAIKRKIEEYRTYFLNQSEQTPF